MENGRLVTHHDTDGIVSGALMYAMRKKNSDKIVITDYKYIDAVDEWKFKFDGKDIVVDLPQPDIKVRFWADHHQTGMRYDKPTHPYLFDSSQKSCAGFLYRHFLVGYPMLSRFEELVLGAEVVDSAGYRKPEELHD